MMLPFTHCALAISRRMTPPRYSGWFIEGFDTADLKDAKALLDELGR
jgi:hypothetical protein